MTYSKSIAKAVNDSNPSINMSSVVSCQNEVASFHCGACDNHWLSRPPTVRQFGCPACNAEEAEWQYQLARAERQLQREGGFR